MRAGTVALTGANGEIGRATHRRLVQDGYSVTCIDVDRRSDLDLYVRADLTSPWEARLAIDSATTVVHLAAVGNCDHADDLCAARHEKLIRNNVMSTYNVFEAVADAEKPALVVWASSETVVGPPFTADTLPDYLPVDAAHPRRPMSPYGLSKLLCEEIATYFWRVKAVPSVGLRFSMIRSEMPSTDTPVSVGLWNLWGYTPLDDAVEAIVAQVADEDPRSRRGAHVEHVVADTPAASVTPEELRRRFLPNVPVSPSSSDGTTFWAPGSRAQDGL